MIWNGIKLSILVVLCYNFFVTVMDHYMMCWGGICQTLACVRVSTVIATVLFRDRICWWAAEYQRDG